jgi:hypothetical protein
MHHAGTNYTPKISNSPPSACPIPNYRTFTLKKETAMFAKTDNF